MARIKKLDTETDAGFDPRLSDEIRRFILYADDLIKEQRSVKCELGVAQEALLGVSKAYERTYRAIAKRETEGITVHLSPDIENARRQLVRTLAEPLARAEGIARETRFAAFFSGMSGAVIGSVATTLILIWF
jgi:hypothetical protein